MFTKLTDASKAVVFSVLVLTLAVGAALLIRMLGLSSGMDEAQPSTTGSEVAATAR
jgi:hypothetical protein